MSIKIVEEDNVFKVIAYSASGKFCCTVFTGTREDCERLKACLERAVKFKIF